MKSTYKGFELEAKREKCLGGWNMTYFTATRLSDGYELISAFSEGRDSLSTYIEDMKSSVDDYLFNPEGYED